MANSKRRCRECKKYSAFECGIFLNNAYYCDRECIVRYGMANKEKGKRIKHREQKREYVANKLTTRKRAAKEACHLYIRTRDKGKPCICCGEPLGDSFHAGHFWESGNFSFIRFNEDNIHGQKESCNTYKGGDSGFYRQNLIERIGLERVQYLDDNRSNKTKLTADDYREIEAEYKVKLEELINKG